MLLKNNFYIRDIFENNLLDFSENVKFYLYSRMLSKNFNNRKFTNKDILTAIKNNRINFLKIIYLPTPYALKCAVRYFALESIDFLLPKTDYSSRYKHITEELVHLPLRSYFCDGKFTKRKIDKHCMNKNTKRMLGYSTRDNIARSLK